MPVFIKHLGGNQYRVQDASGKIHAKSTTLKKAQAQKRILGHAEYKKLIRPKPKPKTKPKKK